MLSPDPLPPTPATIAYRDEWPSAFPTYLWIGAIRHQVQRVPSQLNGRAMGLYEPTLARISVLDTCSPDQARSTLLHECLEGINGLAELDLDHQTICTLEVALDSLFVHNAALLRLYAEGCERWLASAKAQYDETPAGQRDGAA